MDFAEADGRALPLTLSGYRGLFDRRLADGEPMQEFVRRVDALMEQGQVLKRDHASFVSRVRWNGHDLVVKRYNHRGLWHSLRHTIKGSRARRNWRNAHRLLSLKIVTPEPLAYLEEYRRALLWQSYLVTRFVAGSRVRDVLRDETAGAAEKKGINDQVLTLLRVMAEHGISHGDMKHSNILYDGTGIVLTDLDAMRSGGIGWLRRRRYERDVHRYLRDLSDLSTTSMPSQGTK